jgi:hypothetical protein
MSRVAPNSNAYRGSSFGLIGSGKGLVTPPLGGGGARSCCFGGCGTSPGPVTSSVRTSLWIVEGSVEGAGIGIGWGSGSGTGASVGVTVPLHEHEVAVQEVIKGLMESHGVAGRE